jgi:hypothetical protein
MYKPAILKILVQGYNDKVSQIYNAYIKQGCHKGRFWRKITIRTSARVRVYPVDGFLPSADAVKTASARTHPSVRADAKKKLKKTLKN